MSAKNRVIEVDFRAKRATLPAMPPGERVAMVHVLRPEADAEAAYALYVEASQIDEDPKTYAKAEELYRRAVRLDPSLAIAYTNLGNLRFRLGDEPGALGYYDLANARDPEQPEAHYNLGYIALERGELATARTRFESAIERDANFADAHFNLAMTLENMGERNRARSSWKRYLELEPTGKWADEAKRCLKDNPAGLRLAPAFHAFHTQRQATTEKRGNFDHLVTSKLWLMQSPTTQGQPPRTSRRRRRAKVDQLSLFSGNSGQEVKP